MKILFILVLVSLSLVSGAQNKASEPNNRIRCFFTFGGNLIVAQKNQLYSLKSGDWKTLLAQAPGDIDAIGPGRRVMYIAVDRQIYLYKMNEKSGGAWVKVGIPSKSKIKGMLATRFGEFYVTAGSRIYHLKKDATAWTALTKAAPKELTGLSMGRLGYAAAIDNEVYRYDDAKKEWVAVKPKASGHIEAFLGIMDNYMVLVNKKIYLLKQKGDKWQEVEMFGSVQINKKRESADDVNKNVNKNINKNVSETDYADVLNYLKTLDKRFKEMTVDELKKEDVLELNDLEITDAGIKELVKLKLMTGLELRNTKITDAGLKELTRLKSLTALYVGGTKISDVGMNEISKMTALEMLDLSDTNVTDQGLKKITNLKSLWMLYLGGTKVTENGVKSLKEVLPKCRVPNR